MRKYKMTVAITRRILLCAILFSFLSTLATAQKNSIKGVVSDTSEKKKLAYAIVALINLKDTTLYQSQRTTEDGNFMISAIPSGKYRLMISFPRMADYLEEITITDTTKKDMGKLPMVLEAVLLKEVVVRYAPPIRMKGDTLEYKADSFMVKPGANVGELLKRLPGMQVDRNGKITAQGKEVKKVLVDGDEFFSDDPGLATQYLKADAVDKVQVFDKKSDVAEFTGIDDGKRTKTINLTLKENKKNGYFGKATVAAGAKDYYNHEGMAALFKGSEKMAVFGLASKTGKNALNNYELTKYVSQDYERIEDGTGRLMFMNNNDDYESESYYGAGIPTVVSGGAHFSDKWKKDREKLFINYRVKNVDASGWDSSRNTSMMEGGKYFSNRGNSANKSSDFSQKASGSFALPVDSFSLIKISMNGRWNKGNNLDTGYSESKNELGFFVNNSKQLVRRQNEGRSFSANIGYNLQFRKKGRTLAVSLQKEQSHNNSSTYNYGANVYFEPASGVFKNSDTLNQLQAQTGTLASIGAQAKYSDKFSEHFYMAMEYSWKRADAGNVFLTFNNHNGKYEDKVDSLSNDYHFIANTHVTGATLSWNQKKMQVTIGGKFFFTGFQQKNNTSNQITSRHFINWAPSANVSFQPSQTKQISFSYNGHTDQPSIEQLQPLRQSSNPLYVQVGNVALVPSFQHNISMNYYAYNWVKGNSMNIYISGNYTHNEISYSSNVDSNNRTINQSVNVNGIVGYYGGANYSWEYKKIHLRPSVNVSFNHNGSSYFLNGLKHKNENYGFSATAGANYDIEKLMTMNYSATGNFNIGNSTINNNSNRTWSHSHTAGATVYLPLKMELSSNCVFNFQPKNASFNTSLNTVQWDVSFSKKLFKNDRCLLKLSVNDILNNNTGVSRSISGEGNIYEDRRLVIKRYWLLGFTWNFSKN